jgi:hypothetical protein
LCCLDLGLIGTQSKVLGSKSLKNKLGLLRDLSGLLIRNISMKKSGFSQSFSLKGCDHHPDMVFAPRFSEKESMIMEILTQSQHIELTA